jgi:hypothetical protein
VADPQEEMDFCTQMECSTPEVPFFRNDLSSRAQVCVGRQETGTFFFQFFETGSHCIPQTSLKLAILLPLPLKYWDYRHTPPCLVLKSPFDCGVHLL